MRVRLGKKGSRRVRNVSYMRHSFSLQCQWRTHEGSLLSAFVTPIVPCPVGYFTHLSRMDAADLQPCLCCHCVGARLHCARQPPLPAVRTGGTASRVLPKRRAGSESHACTHILFVPSIPALRCGLQNDQMTHIHARLMFLSLMHAQFASLIHPSDALS